MKGDLGYLVHFLDFFDMSRDRSGQFLSSLYMLKGLSFLQLQSNSGPINFGINMSHSRCIHLPQPCSM